MALTPEQRKTLLGFGGLQRAATLSGTKAGHVSQVNAETRPDPTGKVRRAITAVIRDNLAAQSLVLLEHEDIWPAPQQNRAVAAIVAGAKGR